MENMACCAVCEPKGDELIIDIDIPLIMEPPLWPECCIYKVPEKLRHVSEEAYTPKVVSIGPFHYHLEESRGVKMQKLKYFKDFCFRTKKSPEDLASIIEENEANIRRYYSETFETINKNMFVNMILLDAIFIIELFLSNYEFKNKHDEQRKKYDYILSNAWVESHVKQDLILLENQLPFEFLQKFYKYAFDGKEVAPFLELACQFFFSDKHPIKPCMETEVKHFTDLQRKFYSPKYPPKPEPDPEPAKNLNQKPEPDPEPTKNLNQKLEPDPEPPKSPKPLNNLNQKPEPDPEPPKNLRYTATKLHEMGLEFEAVVDRDPSKRSLLDIEFAKNKLLEQYPCFNLSWLFSCLPCLKSRQCTKSVRCILKVPQLVIDDQTEVLFRNLIALEQCHYPSNTYICNYVVLMDSFITTKEDVCLLFEKKVILNRRGSSKAVTTFVNTLGHQIVESESRYDELYQQLNTHCDSIWNRLVASLTSVYFKDFWRGTATIVGILFLGVTFVNFLRPFVIKN